ncbi:MAG: trypsin-like peptidase domain-containing protein, partial [Kofleriaceae bacterium]|nr:trypsin-like peptidase domain-containing protein [Kofleriaceae bacterium]
VMAQEAAPAEAETPTSADADTVPGTPGSREGKPDTITPASDAPGALPQSPVDPYSQGTVQYAAVDAATHRVFAIGSVGLVMVDADGIEVPLALTHSGHGTGFAVGPDGFIVTAGHVADDAVHLVIRLPGEGGFRSAQVAYRDEDQDVAILWVDEPIVPLQLASPENRLRVRQTVYAIGYPLDASRTQAQSARGIVAGQIEADILQLDISLNPGNSGGPLVDEEDRVVGMVVARGDVESGVQGLGIAIATPRIRRALKQAKAKLTKGELKPPGQTQRDTAEVVDRLLRLGVFHTVRESNGLSQGFTEKNLEAEITKLAGRVADPDLLLYLAGSMWNGGQVLIHGKVRKIGDTTLSNREAKSIGKKLREAARKLVARAFHSDRAIAKRSKFARYILDRYDIRWEDPDEPDEPDEPYTGGRLGYVNAQLLGRINLNSGTKAFGFGVDVGAFVNSPELEAAATAFAVVGLSAGRVSLSSETDDATILHTYYAVELGLGISSPAGENSRADFSLSILPGQYESTVVQPGTFAQETRSTFVLGHFRASLNFTYEQYRFGVGMHFIGSNSVWVEPARFGFRF